MFFLLSCNFHHKAQIWVNFSSIGICKLDHIGFFFEEGDFLEPRHLDVDALADLFFEFLLLDDSGSTDILDGLLVLLRDRSEPKPHFGLMVRLDLFVLVLHGVEDGGLLDDVVGELVPVHQAVAVQVDVVEQQVQAPDQFSFAVADVQLPVDEVVFDDHDEVVDLDFAFSLDELALQHVDRERIEVQRQVVQQQLVWRYSRVPFCLMKLYELRGV